MKKLVWILLLLCLLCGCSPKQKLETVGNACMAEPQTNPSVVQIALPQEVATPVIQSDETGKLYLCDGYCLMVQTLNGGDLRKTIKNCTGFEKDELTVMTTQRHGISRYECAWTATGEGADQICRIAIIDDGTYHYVLTAMADVTNAEACAQQWQEIFGSFTIDTAKEPVDKVLDTDL